MREFEVCVTALLTASAHSKTISDQSLLPRETYQDLLRENATIFPSNKDHQAQVLWCFSQRLQLESFWIQILDIPDLHETLHTTFVPTTLPWTRNHLKSWPRPKGTIIEMPTFRLTSTSRISNSLLLFLSSPGRQLPNAFGERGTSSLGGRIQCICKSVSAFS